MSVAYSLLGFLIVIGVLVFIHEWGHYVVARFFGVKVLRFSIGFGPVLWRRQWGETEWAISAVPLGGYVRFLDEREGPVDETERHRAFNRLPPLKRMAVVAAGPLINLLFAWWLFALVFMIGGETQRPVLKDGEGALWVVEAVNETPVTGWNDLRTRLIQARLAEQPEVALTLRRWPDLSGRQVTLPLTSLDMDRPDVTAWLKAAGLTPSLPPLAPIVGQVQPDSPAARSGLRSGDKIVEIDGQPVKDWQQLVEKIARSPGASVLLTIEREGRRITKTVTLAQREGHGYLGVSPDVWQALPPFFRAEVSYRLGEALAAGFDRSVSLTVMMGQVIVHMLTGEMGLDNLSGPVGIAQFSGAALQHGLVAFLGLMGLMSLSLGLLNLLPIPMLDGGHLLFDAVELLTGRPLSESAQAAGQKLGLLVIILLTALALTNDLARLIHG